MEPVSHGTAGPGNRLQGGDLYIREEEMGGGVEIAAEFERAVGALVLEGVVDIEGFFLVDVHQQAFALFTDGEVVDLPSFIKRAAVDIGAQILCLAVDVGHPAFVDAELDEGIGGVAVKIVVQRILEIGDEGEALVVVGDDEVEFHREVFWKATLEFGNIGAFVGEGEPFPGVLLQGDYVAAGVGEPFGGEVPLDGGVEGVGENYGVAGDEIVGGVDGDAGAGVAVAIGCCGGPCGGRVGFVPVLLFEEAADLVDGVGGLVDAVAGLVDGVLGLACEGCGQYYCSGEEGGNCFSHRCFV